ncbi:MAG: molybdopterin molybdotransferase MoeA, partial [Gemmatimonadales bacterium]
PEAAGRVMQEAIVGRRRLPERDSAAVDGYAVRVADLTRSGPPALRLAGTIAAGVAASFPLPPGQCVAVMTGATVPPETEAVVPLEDARREGELVAFAGVPVPGSGIRRAGDEAQPGEILVRAGTSADPLTLERLAGQGISTVFVPRRARVHLIATGDELVPPGMEPAAGQRVASNLPMLEAMVRAYGGQVERRAVAPDDPGLFCEALAPSLAADLILTIGGTMRGSKDLNKAVLSGLGATFLFEGVGMRPGASCAFAVRGDTGVLCLPGSPGAAFLGFAALGRPLLRALHGRSGPVPAFAARLAEALEPRRDVTLLVAGVVRERTGRLEFHRRGQGWPALGLLAPSAAPPTPN